MVALLINSDSSFVPQREMGWGVGAGFLPLGVGLPRQTQGRKQEKEKVGRSELRRGRHWQWEEEVGSSGRGPGGGRWPPWGLGRVLQGSRRRLSRVGR